MINAECISLGCLQQVCHNNIANNIKVQLFQSLIEAILMYAAETWTYTVVLQKRQDRTYINRLRKTKHSLE